MAKAAKKDKVVSASPEKKLNISVKNKGGCLKDDAKLSCGGGANQDPRLRIRSLDDVACRAIKLKLSCYPKQQVAKNKNQDIDRIHPVVVRELERPRPLRKHVALSFWTQIVKGHNLHGSTCVSLKAPQEEEQVAKELNAILMKLAHCSNPAQTTSSKPREVFKVC